MRYGDSISVLMPVYNGASTVGAAVRSILDQSYARFEFLIIDDGSDDGTQRIVEAFGDPRIRYVRRERAGMGAALNAGLALARYPVVARMDADDIAFPERFEKQVRFLDAHPEVSVVSSWYAAFEDGRVLFAARLPVSHDEIVSGMYLHAGVTHGGCMFRKQPVLDAGGFVNTIAQDYELWNTLKRTVRFANIPEVLLLVRYNRSSHSRSSFSKRDEAIRSIQKRFYGAPTLRTGATEPLTVRQYGWQEYHYGDKAQARRLWKGSVKFRSFRILLAYCSTFLPGGMFTRFKEIRIRLKLDYVLRFSSIEKQRIEAVLRKYTTG